MVAKLNGVEAGDVAPVDSNLESLLAARDQAGSNDDWRVSVCRVATRDSKEGLKEPFLFDIPVNRIEEIQGILLEQYGTGHYRVRVQKNKKRFMQYDLEIEAPTPARSTMSAYTPAPIASTAAAGNDMFLSRLDQMQRDNQAFMLQMVQMMAQRGDPAGGANSIQDVVAIMKELREAAPKTDETIGPKMFQQGMEMMKELMETVGVAGGAKETGLIDLANTFLTSPFAKQLAAAAIPGQRNNPAGPQQQQQQQRRANAPLPGQRRPAPIAAPAAAAAPIADAGEQDAGDLTDDDAKNLAELVVYLVDKAKEGADPALYAEMVNDRLQETPGLETVLDALEETQEPVNLLIERMPLVASYRAWFERLFDVMLPPIDEAGNDDERGQDRREDA